MRALHVSHEFSPSNYEVLENARERLEKLLLDAVQQRMVSDVPLGVFLSGSGSTVLALTKGREMTVAYEMAEAARQASTEGKVSITQPTVRGAYLIDE